MIRLLVRRFRADDVEKYPWPFLVFDFDNAGAVGGSPTCDS